VAPSTSRSSAVRVTRSTLFMPGSLPLPAQAVAPRVTVH
jgi:hypothetical protein